MTAALEPQSAPDRDYLLPLGTTTVQVLVRCDCHPQGHFVNLRAVLEGIMWLKQHLREAPPADLIIESFRCRSCRQTVKVTAKMLHLAA